MPDRSAPFQQISNRVRDTTHWIRSNFGVTSFLSRLLVVRLLLILGAFYLALRLGPLSQTLEMTAIVPLLFSPLVLIGLRNPELLVITFPIVFYAASSEWRFMGLSSLELVGFSMVGLAAARVALRRDSLPHSSLYIPMFLYGLFLSVFLLMFPGNSGNQRLWGSSMRGFALFLGAAVLLRHRRDVTRFVAAMAIGLLVLLTKMLSVAWTLPGFDPYYLGRGLDLIGNYTTWQLNQMAPVLLLCVWLLPDTRLRRLSAFGFLAMVALIMTSTSRGGFVDLTVVLLLSIPFLFTRRLSLPGLMLILLVPVVIWVYNAVADFNYITIMADSLVRDFSEGRSRLDFFLAGWELFLRSPLAGQQLALVPESGPGHSYWGSIMSGYGLPFLLVNLVLMAFIVRDAYLLSRHDDAILSTVGKGMLIGTLVAPFQMFHDSVLHTQTYAMIFWLLRGVTTACLNMPSQPENEEWPTVDNE